MIKYLISILIFLIPFSCGYSKKKEPKLALSTDELVHAMVEMYTINAAININDISFRDSTASVYYKKVSENMGISTEIIRSDFEKLMKMPDSLILIQGRALDTLRFLMDKNYSPSTISIGIN